ncbi:hypothetical protein LU689_29170 [Pseudomonas asiatica]|uniref:hypothetical protein n=1 Tax=Pseudomonas asiatica TaxID=2219225 RepID=UPI000C7C5363|nr:hypothetical protein [Pseudomonas asiatica]MCE0853975.1 hypothetical protein [Pseudomonas asiatica]PLU86306.1 hypothetical protein CXG44_15805 [Pseudomonas plecoglossicida]PLU94059.1 hypothetical protein CXG45_07745 [Pseudomonas plecoglossicida]PLV04900.1 hypothetical protein CXG48_07605 [Pseudomonas plecoglossicida]
MEVNVEACEFMERLIATAGEFGQWSIQRIVEEHRGVEVVPGFCWNEARTSADDPELKAGWLYFAMGRGKFLFVSYTDLPSSRR